MDSDSAVNFSPAYDLLQLLGQGHFRCQLQNRHFNSKVPLSLDMAEALPQPATAAYLIDNRLRCQSVWVVCPYIRHTALQIQVLCQMFNKNKLGVSLQTLKEVRQGSEFPLLYRKNVILYCENSLGHAKGIQRKR